MKRFIFLIVLCVLVTNCTYSLIVNAEQVSTPEKFSIIFKEKEYFYENRQELEKAIKLEESRVDAAQAILENLEILEKNKKTQEIFNLVSGELDRVVALVDIGYSLYDQLELDYETKWTVRKQEYPVASEVWLYFKSLGYNDYVCAGILGNLMAECGGQTFELHYWMYDNDASHFGMCQWSKDYKEIWGKDLKAQCDFLGKTIAYEFNTFEYLFCNYEDFLKITDEQKAALAFSRCYERCGPLTEKIRQINATKAYNYFAY